MSETRISMFADGVCVFVCNFVDGQYTTIIFNDNYQAMEQLHIGITDIQRVDDTYYYIDISKDFGLYAMDKAFTYVGCVIDEPIHSFQRYGEDIFYIRAEDQRMYQYNRLKKKEKVVIRDKVNCFVCCGNQLYYATKDGLFSYALTSNQEKNLLEETCIKLKATGNRVYAWYKGAMGLGCYEIEGESVRQMPFVPKDIVRRGDMRVYTKMNERYSLYKCNDYEGDTAIRIFGNQVEDMLDQLGHIIFVSNHELWTIDMNTLIPTKRMALRETM